MKINDIKIKIKQEENYWVYHGDNHYQAEGFLEPSRGIPIYIELKIVFEDSIYIEYKGPDLKMVRELLQMAVTYSNEELG